MAIALIFVLLLLAGKPVTAPTCPHGQEWDLHQRRCVPIEYHDRGYDRPDPSPVPDNPPGDNPPSNDTPTDNPPADNPPGNKGDKPGHGHGDKNHDHTGPPGPDGNGPPGVGGGKGKGGK